MSYDQRDAVLRVDLTSGTVEREPVSERWRHEFLGGKSLGARYLYDEVAAGTDPLGPENLLALMWGPLSGYLPGESRLAVVTKSPLTGGFLDSYVGGAFPNALAGSLPDCLGVLVTGAAREPTRLVVEANGDATLEPADCWGARTDETDAASDGAVACIGPAGEHRVRYATVATDGGDHHAGRGGAGAVLGAKRLKAVVARGDPPPVPDELVDRRTRTARTYRESDTGRWQAASGTLESVEFADAVDALATRGWRESRFEGSESVGVDAAREAATGRERPESDAPGDFRVRTETGESVPRGGAAMSLGAGLGIDDFDAVATLGATCDRLGLDVIDTGSAVAWAVRASETGVFDRSLSFGDADTARRLVEAIAHREYDLADALADGLDAATDRYGAREFVPSVKAMAVPAYDPRTAPAMALAYATSDRGACHRRARPIEAEAFDGGEWSDVERVERVVREQTARSTTWCLVVDDFVGETVADLGASWLRALGYDHDARSLSRLGERVWTLTRLFNAREGFDRTDDRLPAVLTAPASDGEAALDPDRFEHLLSAYYAARGWGKRGRPTRETLARLGLDGVVDRTTPLDDRTVGVERPADD